MDKMINAGMDAMDTFTINTTIDQNGILTSTILTWFVLLLSILFSISFELIERRCDILTHKIKRFYLTPGKLTFHSVQLFPGT